MLPQAAKDVCHIGGCCCFDEFEIFFRDVGGAVDEDLINDGVIQFAPGLTHEFLPDSKRTLIGTELLCIHFAGQRISVDDIQHIHSTVADVSDQIDAFQLRCKRRNGCVPLGIDPNVRDADGVVHLPIGEMDITVPQKIAFERFFLHGHPGQRQPDCEDDVRFGHSRCFQFFGNGNQRQQEVVLVQLLFGQELFMSFTDEVILAGIDQHISGEQRFGIISGDPGAKTVIRGFDVAVARVYGNDHFVLIQFHVLI